MHAADPPAIEPEVLYEASVGADVDQLGLDDCRECDPARPLSPLVTADGRVVILDAANQRWVTVTDGVPTAVALPADLNVGQMILGPGDMVYVTMSPRDGGPTELVAFESRDLSTVVSRQPVDEPSSYPAFRLDGVDIIVFPADQDAERRLPLTPAGDPPLPSVTPSFDTEPKTLTVTGADGAARVYVFDAGMSLSFPVPLRDGSVVVFSNQTGDTTPPHTIVYRLHPDGSISSVRIDGEDNSYNLLDPFVDERGVVELRQRPEGGWKVVRFPFTG
ncbi:MAG TPA: hypothetical protein VES40_19580 [Ilumatobacteraceae bacterium]|nr:hypothetical protein [Ilumatobacteraceae bacterium]